jgi:tetratricopeptide (TPR) repeat protein
MAENSRIDDLRRRVQKDPASIAFAQLAEECRRSGQHQEAVDTCRAGLAIHPGYLSARVTLGRALIELNQLDEAQVELSRVLESAPENLAAIRGLAEIYHRHGDLSAALTQYRAALQLARNDPDLEETIADLSRQVEPPKPAQTGGLTLAHMQDELLKLAPQPKPAHGENDVGPAWVQPAPVGAPVAADQTGPIVGEKPPVPFSANHETESHETYNVADNPAEGGSRETDSGTLTAAADDHATRTLAALEQWLAAIHVSRQQRYS